MTAAVQPLRTASERSAPPGEPDASALDAQLADMLDADGYRDVIEG